MTSEETIAKYESCIMLIRQIVWDFISHTGLPKSEYEELFSQANLYFMLACTTYKPDKAKFSTWVVIQVWNRLMKELYQTQAALDKLNDPRNRPPIAHSNRRFVEIVDELGSDGLALLMLVRSGELDIEGLLKGHSNGLKTVFRFLREDRGWSRAEIHRSFKEIARLFRE